MQSLPVRDMVDASPAIFRTVKIQIEWLFVLLLCVAFVMDQYIDHDRWIGPLSKNGFDSDSTAGRYASNSF